MTDHKPYFEMTDAELIAAEIEWLGNLADASGPSSAFFASKQCDLIRAEIERREKAAIEAKVHASTVAERETRDNFRSVLTAPKHDPVSFEAGERLMRERSAKVSLEFGDVFRIRHQSSYGEGYTDASDAIGQAIRNLPTGEK